MYERKHGAGTVTGGVVEVAERGRDVNQDADDRHQNGQAGRPAHLGADRRPDVAEELLVKRPDLGFNLAFQPFLDLIVNRLQLQLHGPIVLHLKGGRVRQTGPQQDGPHRLRTGRFVESDLPLHAARVVDAQGQQRIARDAAPGHEQKAGQDQHERQEEPHIAPLHDGGVPHATGQQAHEPFSRNADAGASGRPAADANCLQRRRSG